MRTSYIDRKKTQIHKVLRFSFMSFLILKSLYDNLFINAASYIFFKILVQ